MYRQLGRQRAHSSALILLLLAFTFFCFLSSTLSSSSVVVALRAYAPLFLSVSLPLLLPLSVRGEEHLLFLLSSFLSAPLLSFLLHILLLLAVRVFALFLSFSSVFVSPSSSSRFIRSVKSTERSSKSGYTSWKRPKKSGPLLSTSCLNVGRRDKKTLKREKKTKISLDPLYFGPR